MSLSSSQVNALQLACEEVFMHMCRSPVEEGSSHPVKIQFTSEEDHLHIEMENTASAHRVFETSQPENSR